MTEYIALKEQNLVIVQHSSIAVYVFIPVDRLCLRLYLQRHVQLVVVESLHNVCFHSERINSSCRGCKGLLGTIRI